MKYRVLSADMPSLKSVLPYLNEIHQSGHFSNFGKLEQTYRGILSGKLGVDADQLATCSNATMAIQGVCTVVGLPEWRVQNFSFPATGLAVQNSAKSFEFVDVDLQSWVISEDNSESGSVSVVPFGKSLKDFEFFECGFHLVDAAASLGNLDNLSGLKPNQAVVFSLHATKILGCGEGGVLIFGDRGLAAKFRNWTNFGFSGKRVSELRASTNAKLSEIACAYAIANLNEFPEKVEKYLKLRRYANTISRNLDVLPNVMDDLYVAPYWIIQLKSEEIRNFVALELQKHGIESRQWWPQPLSQMTAFYDGKDHSSVEVNSATLSATTLGLPFHLNLELQDLDFIGRSLEKAL